jgi:hypothetical protein
MRNDIHYRAESDMKQNTHSTIFVCWIQDGPSTDEPLPGRVQWKGMVREINWSERSHLNDLSCLCPYTQPWIEY